MKTITSASDLNLFLDIFFDYDECTWEVFTDKDSSYIATDVVNQHNVVKINVPSDALVGLCSGQIKVRATYRKNDPNYEDGFYDDIKVISTEYYLDNLDIDNRIHLNIPTLLTDTFTYGETIDVLKVVSPLDTIRVQYINSKAKEVGEYTLRCIANSCFDFGRGVNEIDLPYSITPKIVATPRDLTFQFDQTIHLYPDTEEIQFIGQAQTVGTHEIIAHLRTSNYVWDDGTTNDKVVNITIIDEYYTKTESDNKFDTLERVFSNQISATQATHQADKEAQNAVNVALNKDIQDNKKELSDNIESVYNELSGKIQENKEAQQAKDSELDQKIDANKDAQDVINEQVAQQIGETNQQIRDNKSAQDATNGDLYNKIDTNKQYQDGVNDQVVGTLNTIQGIIQANKEAQQTKDSILEQKIDGNKQAQDTKNTEIEQSIKDTNDTVKGNKSAQDIINGQLQANDNALRTLINTNKADQDEVNENVQDQLETLEGTIAQAKTDLTSAIVTNKANQDTVNTDLQGQITQNKQAQETQNAQFAQQLTTIGNDYAKKTDLTWVNIIGAPTTWDWSNITNKPTLFSGDYNDLTNKPDIPIIDLYEMGVGAKIKFKIQDLIINDSTKIVGGVGRLRCETADGQYQSIYFYSDGGTEHYVDYRLSNYTKKSELDTLLADYAKKEDIPSDTISQSELETTLSGYAKKTDIPEDQNLTEYVKKTEIGSYLPTDHVQSTSVTNIVTCTQEQYDAMSSHNSKTFYVIL